MGACGCGALVRGLAAAAVLGVATAACAAPPLVDFADVPAIEGGGWAGPAPTAGWLTLVGLMTVGVVGAVRRRHRALT
jgi:hypothetical protein